MTLRRRLTYALITSALLLGLGELAARAVEALGPPLTPSAPLPSPRAEGCVPDCLPGLATYPEKPEGPGIRMVWSADRGRWLAMPDDAAMQANALGLRGPELPPKAPGELRLLTLGDSSVWGHGVSDVDLFSTRAAEALAARWGRPVRPVVGAQPGHDVAQSWNTLERLGGQIQPDIVLIANLWSDLFHQDSPAFAPPGQAAPSALYRLAHRALGPLLQPRVVGWIDPASGRGLPAPGLTPTTPLPRYMETLERMGRHALALGAQPAYLLLPAPIDLDPAGPPGFVRAWREAMRWVAARLDAPLIEGPAAFQDAGATNAHFFDPVHPSKAGHALLGQVVAEGLGPLRDP